MVGTISVAPGRDLMPTSCYGGRGGSRRRRRKKKKKKKKKKNTNICTLEYQTSETFVYIKLPNLD
jgi:hypothetical protein